MRERFRFATGARLSGGFPSLWVSVVPCSSLGCLSGKDFLEALGGYKKLHCGGFVGWFVLDEGRPLLHEPLSEAPSTTGPIFLHVAGFPNGVCEVPEASKFWRKLSENSGHVPIELSLKPMEPSCVTPQFGRTPDVQRAWWYGCAHAPGGTGTACGYGGCNGRNCAMCHSIAVSPELRGLVPASARHGHSNDLLV